MRRRSILIRAVYFLLVLAAVEVVAAHLANRHVAFVYQGF